MNVGLHKEEYERTNVELTGALRRVALAVRPKMG